MFVTAICTLFLLSVVLIGFTGAQSQGSTINAVDVYSSCTTAELLPQLKNLSHAKIFTTITKNFTCDQTDLVPGTRYITWYYYEKYPPIGCEANQCCFDTQVSTITFITSVTQNLGGNAIITRSGSITTGPYAGHLVNQELVFPLADQTACNTLKGLEARTGTVTLIINGGPTCTGVETAEFCPGIHFA